MIVEWLWAGHGFCFVMAGGGRQRDGVGGVVVAGKGWSAWPRQLWHGLAKVNQQKLNK